MENIWRLDTMTIIVHGRMGHGKTIASILISEHDFWYTLEIQGKKIKKYRIYANFDIMYRGKKISSRINRFSDLRRIRFSRVPGIIIIDEVGINANAKDSRSMGNRLISETNFLARKKNCSLLVISQRFKSIPIDQRDLADLILRVRKSHTKKWKYPQFYITREIRHSAYSMSEVGKWTRWMIQSMNMRQLSYNQLDTSILQ